MTKQQHKQISVDLRTNLKREGRGQGRGQGTAVQEDGGTVDGTGRCGAHGCTLNIGDPEVYTMRPTVG